MCASRKRLRLFCSCFPPHFFYCTSCPILCSAGFPERAGKCFSHCTYAKAVGPRGLVHRAQNQDAGKQGFALVLPQPAGHPWASCVSVLCCVLFAQGMGPADTLAAYRSSDPACTRISCDTAGAAGGLQGGGRCRWAAWWREIQVLQHLLLGMPAWSSALGVLGHCRCAMAPLPHWAFSSFGKRIYSPYGDLQLRRSPAWAWGIKKGGW